MFSAGNLHEIYHSSYCIAVVNRFAVIDDIGTEIQAIRQAVAMMQRFSGGLTNTFNTELASK